jgi:hypothetical protein
VVLRVRGEVSTFIDLRLEKICFVEHCHNQKAPLRGPSVTKRLCAFNCSRKSQKSYACHEAQRLAVNLARLPELLMAQPHWR